MFCVVQKRYDLHDCFHNVLQNISGFQELSKDFKTFSVPLLEGKYLLLMSNESSFKHCIHYLHDSEGDMKINSPVKNHTPREQRIKNFKDE